jgi:quercetin dioxygenase-like cupin family protein
MKLFSPLPACLVAAFAMAPLTGTAQDLAVTAGNNAKVLLDNDKVRVIELQVAPGASTGMHAHGDNIVYYLSGGDAIMTNADGTKKQRHTKAGEIMWSGPVVHDTRNTGQAPVRALVIELKEAAKAP